MTLEKKEIATNKIALGLVFGFLFGFLFGCFLVISEYQIDTYDCTVKCPNMAHSIYAYDKCYCEVK